MAASNFRDKPVILDDAYARTSLPVRFSNEIYLSKTQSINVKYVSPFSIKYVHKGSDLYLINGTARKVVPGSILVNNHGSEVELTADSRKNKVDYNVGMSIFIGSDVIKEIYCSGGANDLLLGQNSFEKTCPLFYEDVIRHDNDFVSYIRSLFLQLNNNRSTSLQEDFYYNVGERFLEFQLKTFKAIQPLTQQRHAVRLEVLKRVGVAREFIDGLGSIAFDLESAARAASLSKYFLIRSFKKVYGVTPQQYHIRNKISLAKELLRKRRPVSEVAYLLGYPNIYYFSKQFTQVTGTVPKSHWPTVKKAISGK